jgi:secreted trypsin-like serine protease
MPRTSTILLAILATATAEWTQPPRGMTPFDHETKIVGGDEATPFEHSFVVNVAYGDGEDAYGQATCGGSLIGDGSVVLTAAHCVEKENGKPIKPNKLTIVIHRHNLSADSDEHECSALIDPVKIVIHPTWSDNGIDAALIFLEEAAPCVADGTDRTKTVRLADADDGDFAGDRAMVMGWGATDRDGYDYPEKMREVEVGVIENAVCDDLYGGTGYGGIRDYEVCARDQGKDSCFGDSGGPLVVGDTLIGIVSWGGTRCATFDEPGVYARVSEIRDWIDSEIDGNDNEEDNECDEPDDKDLEKCEKWLEKGRKKCACTFQSCF